MYIEGVLVLCSETNMFQQLGSNTRVQDGWLFVRDESNKFVAVTDFICPISDIEEGMGMP